MALRSRCFAPATILAALTTATFGCGVSQCGGTPSGPVEAGNPAQGARTYVYVFSHDGRYAKFDAVTVVPVSSGSLGDANVHEVEGIVPDPERKNLLVKTSRGWSSDAAGPTTGLVILAAAREGTTGGLRATRVVAPPRGMDQFIGAIVVPGAPRRVVATWTGPEGLGTLVVGDDDGSAAPKASDRFAVGPASCAASDSRVYSLASTKTLEIRSLTLQDLSVRNLPFTVGDAAFAPMTAAGTGDGCSILLLGRPSKPTTEKVQLPAYIYNLESQKVVSQVTLPGHGDFSFSRSANLIAVDEKTFVPNVLPSGKTVGLRYKKTGVLRVFDAASGAELGVARLPEDGQLSAIEGSTGYYVSPSLLSVVDLKTGKTTGTASLPFARGFVALHDER
jgi:hypothetical protein